MNTIRKRAPIAIIFAVALPLILFNADNSNGQDRPLSSSTSPAVKQPCGCPVISIASTPKTAKIGDTVEFYVDSNDPELLKGTFEWTVSRGKIISGQGTSKILVQTSEVAPTPHADPSPSTAKPEIQPSLESSGLPQSFLISPPLLSRGRPLTITVTRADSILCKCPATTFAFKVALAVEPLNQPADVEDIKLNKTSVVLPCEPGRIPLAGIPAPDPIVNVTTIAKDPENDVLSYHYTISGGRIIGKGANVQWDLTGVAPGTYTITAGVDDGCGICGRTMTQTVTAEACTPTCGLVDCPELSLTDGKINNDDEYEIAANVSGGSQDQSITYQWTVTNGQIISGQGTPSVKVKAWTTSRDVEPTVKVKIGGLDPKGFCIDEASVSIPKD